MTIAALSFYGYRYFESKKNFSEARELASAGYKTDAFNISIGISSGLKKDPGFTLFYTSLLFDTKRLESAIEWFHKFHRWHCNQRIHCAIAKCYDELRDFDKAEEHYLLSLYLTPHLLQSRIDLMEFYSRYHRINEACYWANEAMQYPAKVQNDRVGSIRKKAENFLLSMAEKK